MLSEHFASQLPAEKFDELRRVSDAFASGIHAIYGMKNDDDMRLQAIHFSSSKFTTAEAKTWLEQHGKKTTVIEAIRASFFQPMIGKFGSPTSETMEGTTPRAKFKKSLIRTGQYIKDSENLEFTVTDETLKHWVKQFKRMTENGVKVPMPATHEGEGDPDKNRGYILDMYVEGDALVGVCEMIGSDAIVSAERSDVSIASPTSFVDGKGQKYDRPITHVALVTDPVVPGLGEFVPLAASRRSKQTMNWKNIQEKLGIKGDALTDETAEAAILSFHDERTKAFTALEAKFTKSEESGKALATSLKNAEGNGVVRENVDPLLVRTVGDAAAIQLGGLVKDGKITPAVSDDLQSIFVGDDCKTLAASMKTQSDPMSDFNKVVKALEKNDPLKLGEKTGAQTESDLVTLSRSDAGKNVLMEDAKKRVKAAEQAAILAKAS